MTRGGASPTVFNAALQPKELVVQGPYRYVRNPMYVAVLLVFQASALLGYAAVCVGFNLFILAYEEPVLRRQFGEAYRRSCAAVPRWIPRLRRRKDGT